MTPTVITYAVTGSSMNVRVNSAVPIIPGRIADSAIEASTVERAVRIVHDVGRPVATPAEARTILQLGARV